MVNPFQNKRVFRAFIYAVEIAFISLLAINFSQVYLNPDPDYRLMGMEAENVTAQAQFLHSSLNELGYIPYWQPYSNEGFPAVDDAYSFIVNPFNFVPIALLGGNNGVKIAIVIHFIIAGIGGWFLGYTLNMGFLGRLMLGALMVLKGNMQSTIGIGFFQLGIAQAYLPWVMAGALAIPRYPNRRYPVVLLAASLALMFYCGTLFYVMPAVLLAGFVFLFYAFRFSRHPLNVSVNWNIFWKFVLAGAFSAGLTAVIALTIGLNFSLLGNHPGEWEFPYSDAVNGLRQFIEPEPIFRGLFSEFLYSYILPLWYLILLFILLPPIWKLQRSANPKLDRRLWGLLILGLIIFTAWGVSLRPFIPWLYEQFPLLAQWRMPQRFLGVASFLLAFLLAFRLDGLHRALITNVPYTRSTGRVTKGLVTLFLFGISWMAVSEVNQRTYNYSQIEIEDTYVDQCVRWLKAQFPDSFISVFRRDFITTSTFIRNGVRLAQIDFAYDINGMPSTLYAYDLTNLRPEFFIPAWDQTTDILLAEGLIPLEGSPPATPEYPTPCAWRDPRGFPYVFTVAMDDLLAAPDNFPYEIISPAAYARPVPEYTAVLAVPDPDELVVVIAQDVAYPGWTVRVNGEAAQLESVGQLLGVVLQPGTTPQIIEFIYTAPTLKLGGVITIATIVLCIAYLLRVDQLPRRSKTTHESRARHKLQVDIRIAPQQTEQSGGAIDDHGPNTQLWSLSAPSGLPRFMIVLLAALALIPAYVFGRFKPSQAEDQALDLTATIDDDPPEPAHPEEE